MCYIHVPTAYEEYQHFTMQACMKKERKKKKEDQGMVGGAREGKEQGWKKELRHVILIYLLPQKNVYIVYNTYILMY